MYPLNKMSYKDKIETYQSDCDILLGRLKKFSEYIKEFATAIGIIYNNSLGLDLGAGPGGCNADFFTLSTLDGCDQEQEVVNSLPKGLYNKTFAFSLGKDQLPYSNNSLDFIVCSCVIQHLNSFQELIQGLGEIYRVLKPNGYLYLMYKVGTNDTILTHHNSYYDEDRSFRVFSPSAVHKCTELTLLRSEYLLDDNYIPYNLDIYQKS